MRGDEANSDSLPKATVVWVGNILSVCFEKVVDQGVASEVSPSRGRADSRQLAVATPKDRNILL
jgi:hypothetical protein